ncbi:unnamed protein product [Rhizophagus irregularis]|nr:unnamed protein product [Rhizophagus irregularis]CAB5394055.1 unnamed protein product [Rhizophagus irregularis]
MEEASRQRKERLEALRKRKLDSDTNKNDAEEDSNNIENPILKFRNYTPINEDIKSISTVNIATPKDITDTLENTVEKIAKQVKEEEEKKREEEVDLFNLAPKKPNWDLKRDVEKKLAKLEKKTQSSIAELIRIRLQSESNEDASVDLVDAVNAQQKADTDEINLNFHDTTNCFNSIQLLLTPTMTFLLELDNSNNLTQSHVVLDNCLTWIETFSGINLLLEFHNQILSGENLLHTDDRTISALSSLLSQVNIKYVLS